MPFYIMLTTAINSTYSCGTLLWIGGFISFSRTGKCSQRQRYFYPFATYVLVGISNLILRFAWAANKLSLFAELDAASLVLCLELIEVFRRSVWNMYRIEWEIISVEAKGRNVSKEDLDGLDVTRGRTKSHNQSRELGCSSSLSTGYKMNLSFTKCSRL